MKTILVTGAQGFIGKNLVADLRKSDEYTLLQYDIDNTLEELEEYITNSDFIIHLAGVNRTENVKEFEQGNSDLTKKIIAIMNENNKHIPILITSSIQAELDNPYGVSKKIAEDAVKKWSRETYNKAYIFRLPNVFGKWCRPNYNSVVATFCYNIAHELPIRIDDPDKVITLVYIDDIIDACLAAINGKLDIANDGYCYIKNEKEISLQELADKIYSFKSSRENLTISDFNDELTRRLYATYLSYLDEKKFEYSLQMKHDNRGWLAEFIKSDHFGQIFISKTKAGITRGNHWHHTKIEKFLVVHGQAAIKLRHINKKDVIEYIVSDENLKVVDIPPGYTHSIENIGSEDVITIFWADERFDSEKPDTYYEEVENE